jgi:hypothetical protein
MRMGICDDNANCTDTIGAYICDCHTGYMGDGLTCADIDECDTNTDDCHVLSDCINTNGSFVCNCFDGYEMTANETCIDIDECT